MIEVMKGLPDNVVGLSAKEEVTGNDYDTVLIPLVSEKIKKHGKVRMLYQLGPDFAGYDAAAIWDDTMFGMSHMFDFEKVAVVSDVEWIRNATRFFGVLLPCPVKTFDNKDLAAAKTWIIA